MAKTCTKDGHKQTNKTSTKIQTKRTKKHRTTEEEMEGPTSYGGSRNRLTCLTLQEHDDDDDIYIYIFEIFKAKNFVLFKVLKFYYQHYSQFHSLSDGTFNPLNSELNPICHLLALFEAHHILHVSRIRVNILANYDLKNYIYIYKIWK